MANNEFDFDELDKAVSSLMGSKSPKVDDKAPADSDPEDSEPELNTVDLDQPVDHSDQQDDDVLTIEETDIPKPEENPDLQAIENNLDMVDGNSDEKSDQSSEDATQDEESESETDQEETESEPQPASRTARRPSTGRHMDIVRSPGNNRIGKTIAPSASATVATPPVSETPPEEVPQTPFLPDANEKVQKRPLGWPFVKKGSVAAEAEPEPEPESAVDVEAQQSEEPVNSDETKPAESEPEEIVEVKDDPTRDGKDGVDTGKDIDATKMTPEEVSEARELQEIEAKELDSLEDKLDAEEKAEPTIREVESGDTERMLNAATADDDLELSDNKPAAIYDTTDYHKPLAHPAKRKSGLGIIIAIVLIIAIGVALGAAAYFILGIGA